MLKTFFKNEKQLEDYNLNVELFNSNNHNKIGDTLYIQLTDFRSVRETKIIEVTLELALYGLADDEEPFKYCFMPIFVVGDINTVPEKGDEYAERIFWSEFELNTNNTNMSRLNHIRFNTMHYEILDTQE